MDLTKRKNQLKQQVKALIDEANVLLSKEDLTEDDLKAVTEKQTQAETLKTQIDALDKQIEMLRAMEPESVTPADSDPDPARIKAPEGKPFASFGEQLQAIAHAGTPGMSPDPRLLEVNAAASGGAAAVPSDGGYFIQADFASGILSRVYETGILASKCRQVEISAISNKLIARTIDETSRATGSRFGGVQVYRANEADTVTAKKPKFGKLELALEKLMGLAYVTDELLEDAAALETIYKQAFTSEFGFVMDDEIVRGTGAGQCLGLLNAGALVTVNKETGQEADTLVKENIDKMWSRLYAPARMNAVWLINQEVEPQLDNLQMVIGTGGVPVYLPPGGLADTPYARLKGRPVIPIEHCAALGDLGDILLVNLSEYLLIKKGGLKQDSSMHVRFIYGEMTFRFTMRNNGQPLWERPLTPYKGASTLSPFVTLQARA